MNQKRVFKILAGSLFAAVIVGLLVFRLGNLVGASPTELQTINSNQSLSVISNNPLHAPYKILVYALLKLPGSTLVNLRLASVFITCLSIGLFFVITRRWYGLVSGLWTTMLFGTSGWVLHTGRFGSSYCMTMLLVLIFITMAVWLNRTSRHSLALQLYAITYAIALFIPGGIWFIALTAIMLRKPLQAHRTKARPQDLAIAAAIAVAGSVGLIAMLVQHSELLLEWAGLPKQFPNMITILKQAVSSLSYFIAKGPLLPETWLAHTPLLDAASSILLLLGALFYKRHLSNNRTHLLVGCASIGILLVAFNGATALSFLVPIVYLIIGGGVAYLMHRWNHVFPRNPIARSTALSLMSILLLCIIAFHSQRYFVAWRYSPNTRQAYVQSYQ